MTLKRKSSPARPGKYQLSPRRSDDGFRVALEAAMQFRATIQPDVLAALREIKGCVVDEETLIGQAELLAGIVAEERHIEAGPWFKRQPPKSLGAQIKALADALEAYRAAARGLGLHAGEFVWPWPDGIPHPEDGRQWKLGNDPLAHDVVHGIPPRLQPIIDLLRQKETEAGALNFTGRGRPRKGDAIHVATQAAFAWLTITKSPPTYSGSESSDGGPFARLVQRLFELGGISAKYRDYAQKAAAKMGD